MWMLLAVLLVILGLQFYDYWQKSMPVPAETEEKREITILSTYEIQYIRDALGHLTDTYMEQHPEVTVTLEFVNPTDFQKKLCLEKDAESLPEMIICDNVMTPALVSMGIYQDISDKIDQKRTDQYLWSAYSTGLVNGKNYAIPFASDAYVLFYNREFFARNRFETPQSLTDLQSMLESVHTLGNYNFAMACKSEEDLAGAFLQMIYLCGGTILDLNGRGSMQFYEMMESFREKNVMPKDMVNWNQQDLMKAFSDEMVMTAVAKLSSAILLEQENMEFEYGIMEMPYEHNQAYLMHGENIGITVDKEDEAVWSLLEYLTGKEAGETFMRETGKFPVRVDVDYTMWSEKGLDKGFVQRQRSQSMAKKSYSTWFLISSAISEQMLDFLTTSADAKAAAYNMYENVRGAILER